MNFAYINIVILLYISHKIVVFSLGFIILFMQGHNIFKNSSNKLDILIIDSASAIKIILKLGKKIENIYIKAFIISVKDLCFQINLAKLYNENCYLR